MPQSENALSIGRHKAVMLNERIPIVIPSPASAVIPSRRTARDLAGDAGA